MRSQSNKASAGNGLLMAGKPGAMTQRIANGQVFFSGLRKLRPVFCDRRIEFSFPAETN